LRLKLDENVAGAVVGILRSHGHDVHTVLEEALGGRDDPTVLHAAVSEGRVLLTLDRGFGDVSMSGRRPAAEPNCALVCPTRRRDQRL
jgi:predicted nuclease of predicted toxin-antitoxin system